MNGPELRPRAVTMCPHVSSYALRGRALLISRRDSITAEG